MLCPRSCCAPLRSLRRSALAKLAFVAFLFVALVAAPAAAQSGSGGDASERGGVIVDEFIYDDAPFPECHASTIVETPSGLVVAWFGGTREKDPDVEIWVSRRQEGAWSAPVSVADGVQASGERYPCWNPVLVQHADRLSLYYKVGPSPSEWWGMVKHSTDDGATWSDASRLAEGILGPIRNKPIRTADGAWLSGSSSEHDGWRVHIERSNDDGATWIASEALNDRGELESIQPTFLTLPDGVIRMLCRAKTAGRITTADSRDGGATWTGLATIELPNPNSGIDAVTFAPGRHALVYNHTPRGRSPLNLALSDDGSNWSAARVLVEEAGAEFSYPAIIATADGHLHITYTWKRQRIRHVEIDPSRLELRPIVDGVWPE